MKNLLLIASMIFLFMGCKQDSQTEKKVRALLITGGHGFDTTAFFDMIGEIEDVRIDTISQPEANEHLVSANMCRVDVIIFYDMWDNITEEQKNAYYAYAEEGKGFVFLHHSLVSYPEWDEFAQIRGGKYIQNHPDSTKNSDYAHDIDLEIEVLDSGHPVLDGIKDFSIHDEGYSNIEILPDVHPLLATDHPQCAEYVAWTNKFRNSKVVYILLGHDDKAWSNKNYPILLKNAIQWTGT